MENKQYTCINTLGRNDAQKVVDAMNSGKLRSCLVRGNKSNVLIEAPIGTVISFLAKPNVKHIQKFCHRVFIPCL